MTMWTARIRNHAFERMGDFGHVIDGDHFLGRSAFDIQRKKEGRPKANVLKKGGVFELQIAVPGFSKEEIEILLEGEVLKVRGEKNQAAEHQNQEFIVEEFDFNAFERCFKLSPKIARDKIEATFENGVLTLSFEDIPLESGKTHIRIPVA